MNKLLSLGICIGLFLGITGCGGNNEPWKDVLEDKLSELGIDGISNIRSVSYEDGDEEATVYIETKIAKLESKLHLEDDTWEVFSIIDRLASKYYFLSNDVMNEENYDIHDFKTNEIIRPKAITGDEAVKKELLNLNYELIQENVYISTDKDIKFKNAGDIEWIQFDFNEKQFVVKSINDASASVLNWEKGESAVSGSLGTEEDLCIYDLSNGAELAGSCDVDKTLKSIRLSADFFEYLTKYNLFLKNVYH